MYAYSNKNGRCWVHSTRCREDQRGDGAMLNFSYSLVICSSLLLLIFPVALSQSGVAMALSVGVEDPHIKKCLLPITAQKLCADTSSWALSSLLVVLCLSYSVVTCCKVGSMATLWHTSLRYYVVMYLNSLCLMDVNPPHKQFIACSMPISFTQTYEEGRLKGLRQ